MARAAQSIEDFESKKAELVQAIQEWGEQHGGIPPRAKDWQNVLGRSLPSYLTVVRYFGSWDAGIAAAGYSPRGRGKPSVE